MIITGYVARYVTLYFLYALSLSCIVFSQNDNLIGWGGLILIGTSFGSWLIAGLESEDLNRRHSMPYMPMAITFGLLIIGISLCFSGHGFTGSCLTGMNCVTLLILSMSKGSAQYDWDRILHRSMEEKAEREEKKRRRERQEQDERETLQLKNERRKDILVRRLGKDKIQELKYDDASRIADILLLEGELSRFGLIDVFGLRSFIKLDNELLSQMQQSNPLFYNFKFGIAKNMTSKALIQLYDTWYKLLQMPDYKQDVIQFFTLATEAIENRINKLKSHIEEDIEQGWIYIHSVFSDNNKTKARDIVMNTLTLASINNKYQNVLQHYNISILHDTLLQTTNITNCQNIKVDRLNYITSCAHVPLKLYRNLNDPQEMLDITEYIMQYVIKVPHDDMLLQSCEIFQMFQKYGGIILHEISNLYLEHAIYECLLKQDALNQIVASKIHNFHIEINRM